MEVSIIAAISRNNIIGNKGKIPWNVPEEIERFKRLTANKPVIIGRKSYEYFLENGGRPLEDRINIVLTRKFSSLEGGPICCSDEYSALKVASKYGKEAMVIGGKSVYESFLNHPATTKMYLTHIRWECIGDVSFPNVDWYKWTQIRLERTSKCVFMDYEKRLWGLNEEKFCA